MTLWQNNCLVAWTGVIRSTDVALAYNDTRSEGSCLYTHSPLSNSRVEPHVVTHDRIPSHSARPPTSQLNDRWSDGSRNLAVERRCSGKNTCARRYIHTRRKNGGHVRRPDGRQLLFVGNFDARTTFSVLLWELASNAVYSAAELLWQSVALVR